MSNKDCIMNNEITAKEIIFIDADGNNHGLTSLEEAMKIAEEKGHDLVQVKDENNPICKLMDFDKIRYNQKKKEKKQKPIKNKEIRFGLMTALNDMETKANHASDLLSKGCRIKIVLKDPRRRGRDNSEEMEKGLNDILSCIKVPYQKGPKIDRKQNMWSINITP